jgi:two-component system CheB/CheR fusion protein
MHPVSASPAVRHALQLTLAQERQHAVIVLDPSGLVREWTGASERLFGFTACEMKGQSLERFYVEEDMRHGEASWGLQAAASYGYIDEDRWMRRRDGLRIWVCSTTTALHEGEALVGFLRICRDRSDLRGHVETLQQRLAQVDGAHGSQDAALGTLAHELRNPLGEIANCVFLMKRMGKDEPKLLAAAESAGRQVQAIERLVADLLETTRVATGKARLQYEPVPVRALVDEAIETCSAALSARGQSVEVLLPDDAVVDMDHLRMKQVVVNLLHNSSKFSPNGEKIWVKGHFQDDCLVLDVEDHGRGISPEMMPRIFELFAQAKGEGGGAGHGLGLGLGVVKSIVEMHGGVVQARSAGNAKGTEIIVRIPLKRAG